MPVGWNVADIVCLLYMLASLRCMSAPMGGPRWLQPARQSLATNSEAKTAAYWVLSRTSGDGMWLDPMCPSGGLVRLGAAGDSLVWPLLDHCVWEGERELQKQTRHCFFQTTVWPTSFLLDAYANPTYAMLGKNFMTCASAQCSHPRE